MRLLRENSNESLAEACLSARRGAARHRWGSKRRLGKKQPKKKEVNTKSTTGIKSTRQKTTEDSEHLEVCNGCSATSYTPKG